MLAYECTEAKVDDITLVLNLQGHSSGVFSVSFSHDSSMLASGSGDGTIKIWDPGHGTDPLHTLRGHTGPVLIVSFSHDSSMLASGSFDNTIKIWDPVAGGAALRTLTGHSSYVYGVSFSHDSSMLASGSADETIKIWDPVAGGDVLNTLTEHTDDVRSVSFSHDSSMLASGSADKTIKIRRAVAPDVTFTPPLVPPIAGSVHELDFKLSGPNVSSTGWYRFSCFTFGRTRCSIRRFTSNNNSFSTSLYSSIEEICTISVGLTGYPLQELGSVSVVCPAGFAANGSSHCIPCGSASYAPAAGSTCLGKLFNW